MFSTTTGSCQSSLGGSDHGLQTTYPCHHQLQAPRAGRARSRSFARVTKYAPGGTRLWITTTTGSGTDIDQGSGIATDPRGNSYVTGSFRGAVTFGTGEAHEIVLNAVGGTDLFVAKYASDGSLLWARSAGGPATQMGLDIATDPRGNSYVTGIFQSATTFGADEAHEAVLTASSGSDVFVAKYASDGTFLWATSGSGTDTQDGIGIATDPRGNSYVTGAFRNTVTFGAGEANETVLDVADEAAAGGTDVFVAKFAPDGSLSWATSAGGADPGDGGLDIATDPRGNSYVTGIFHSTARFGNGEAHETVLNAVGGLDVFVAKYARGGTLLWATSAGGPSSDVGSGITTNPRGEAYVAGGFEGTATFGADEAHETTLESAGGNDMFVAKFAPDGTLLWATSAGGIGSDGGSSIATDPRGEAYVAGGFEGTATFGAGEPNETELTALGNIDIFVAKYGVSNEEDQCPDPDLSATVVLDGNDTGVDNVLTNTDGCSIMDLIRQASDEAADRTDFIRQIALLTRTFLRDGLITAEEAGIIRTAASQATFPLS